MDCYLKGIDSFCGKVNLGGLLIIEYIPTTFANPTFFEKIISGGYNWQNDIVLVDGADWLKAPVLPDPRLFRERQRETKQGRYYDQTVEAIVPRHTPELAGEMNVMKQYRYILRLTNRNGSKFLVGTLEHPCIFESDLDTGSKTPDLKHHKIRWTSKNPEKAYGFNPI